MKKFLLVTVALLAAFFSNAQSDDNTTLDFYGFVRVDAYMDSYKGVMPDTTFSIFYPCTQHQTE